MQHKIVVAVELLCEIHLWEKWVKTCHTPTLETLLLTKFCTVFKSSPNSKYIAWSVKLAKREWANLLDVLTNSVLKPRRRKLRGIWHQIYLEQSKQLLSLKDEADKWNKTTDKLLLSDNMLFIMKNIIKTIESNTMWIHIRYWSVLAHWEDTRFKEASPQLKISVLNSMSAKSKSLSFTKILTGHAYRIALMQVPISRAPLMLLALTKESSRKLECLLSSLIL